MATPASRTRSPARARRGSSARSARARRPPPEDPARNSCDPIAFEYAMGVRKLLVSLATAAAVIAAVSSPAQASSRQFTLFEAPRELLSADDTLRDSTLDEIQGFGVNTLRVVILWRSVAPSSGSSTPPAGFDSAGQDGYLWAPYDRVINEAHARGMKVLVTLSG